MNMNARTAEALASMTLSQNVAGANVLSKLFGMDIESHNAPAEVATMKVAAPANGMAPG